MQYILKRNLCLWSLIIGLIILFIGTVGYTYYSNSGKEGEYIIRGANENEEFVCAGKFYLKEKDCGIEIHKITSLKMYIRDLNEHEDSTVVISEEDNNKVFYINYPTLIIEKD